MRPSLAPGVFVFATATGNGIPAGIDPQMVFRESEGLTLIVPEERSAAAPGSTAIFRCRMVTLDIHSSLDAVGFMAAITTRLAASGHRASIRSRPISTTICSCRPTARRKRSRLLEQLAAEARG